MMVFDIFQLLLFVFRINHKWKQMRYTSHHAPKQNRGVLINVIINTFHKLGIGWD